MVIPLAFTPSIPLRPCSRLIDGRARHVCSPRASLSETPVKSQGPGGTGGVQERLREMTDAIYEGLFGDVSQGRCGLRMRGWELIGGNYVKKPEEGWARDLQRGEKEREGGKSVKAVVHFLGGAFVGAAPHLSYRRFLERLAARGYVVVATPYKLSFDYMKVVDEILQRWDCVETDLALEFGSVPVVGVGHSAGALMLAISEALFDEEYAKAGNILISFTNKPARSAIPLFREVVAPLIRLYLAVVPEELRKAVFMDVPDMVEKLINDSPLTPSAVLEDLLPVARSSRKVLSQIGGLVDEVGKLNITEFRPPPDTVKASLESMYDVPETLIVRFNDDSIDESERLFSMLTDQPSSRAQTSLTELHGTHLTPLTPDLPQVANDALGILLRDPLNSMYTKDLHALEKLIDEWIVAGVKNGRL